MTQMWRVNDTIGARVPEVGGGDFAAHTLPFPRLERGHDTGRALPSGWWLVPMLVLSLGFWVWLGWALFG